MQSRSFVCYVVTRRKFRRRYQVLTPQRVLMAKSPEVNMLYWALVFLIVAIVAGVLGFGGVAAAAAGIAKILFYIFLIVFLVMLIMGLAGRSRV